MVYYYYCEDCDSYYNDKTFLDEYEIIGIKYKFRKCNICTYYNTMTDKKFKKLSVSDFCCIII